MRTPIEQSPATGAHKWFKEYMAMANRAGIFSLLFPSRMSTGSAELKKIFLGCKRVIQHNVHGTDLLLYGSHGHG